MDYVLETARLLKHHELLRMPRRAFHGGAAGQRMLLNLERIHRGRI
jgi:hypothetical protein